MVIYKVILSGWWFGTMDFYDFPIILGISSSQLTIRPSFFRGVGLNHQPVDVGPGDLLTLSAGAVAPVDCSARGVLLNGGHRPGHLSLDISD